MIDKPIKSSDFPAFASYATFILENIIEKATEENIALAKELKLPILHVLANLSESELYLIFEANLKEFLQHAVNGTVLKYSEENLRTWYEGKHELVSRGAVTAKDISLGYSIRKRLFLRLIENYTSDPGLICKIVDELEELYSHLIQLALQHFVEIQKEEVESLNNSLYHQKMELEAMNEELQASEEELKAANEELQASDEELRAANEELYKSTQKLQDLNENLENKVKARTNLLEEQREWLHNLFIQVPGLISVLKGKEGKVILCNATFSKFWGMRDVIGKPMREAWPELNGKGLLKLVEEAYTKNKTLFANEYPAFVENQDSHENELRFFNFIFAPFKNASGIKEGVIVYGVDVSEQVNARKAVAESEEQLRLITDALPVLITYVDKEERYRFNNKAYEKWFNIPRSEVYGKHIKEVLGPTAYNAVKDLVSRALNGETIHLETQLQYKDAGLKNVAINYIPHVNNEEVLGYYALISDVSEHVKAKQELENYANLMKGLNEDLMKKNEDLRKLNIDLDNFIYTASHDLKSPIVNLEGLVALLKKQFGHQFQYKEQNLIAMVEKSISQLHKTILDLTEIAKVQKEIGGNKSEVSFKEIIDEVLNDIQYLNKGADADILEDIAVDKLFFNRNSLRSIIYNLLSNALKYRSTERKLSISISTFREARYIVLCITDNGLGISKHQQPKLFSMFKRLHTHVEGTGIGLYIIKRIVENIGGKIEVESEENVGSKFKVYFPSEVREVIYEPKR